MLHPSPTHRLGGYREFPPPPELSHAIEAVWTYHRPVGVRPIPGAGHRVLPDPELNLCFWTLVDARGRIQESSLRLMGPIRTLRFFEPEAGLRVLAARVKAEWSRVLLDADPLDRSDTVERSERGRRWRSLHARMARSCSMEMALRLLYDGIDGLGRDAPVDRSTALAHAGLEHIRRSTRATLDMDALCRSLGVSLRHLRRSISAVGGATPKSFHRIHRFHRAVVMADGSARPEWSKLAVRCGFYDQAHLIQEFRSFSELSPTRLKAERSLQAPAPC